MRLTAITERLAGLGGGKWEVHLKARALAEAGADLVEMTIGEPDVPTPQELCDAAALALQSGRTGYSNGRGEAGLCAALAETYTESRGRQFLPENILCFPGTQTALFAVMQGVAEAGSEVLVGDPMYATYEGVIRASGAEPVPVPLRAENGFRLHADDLAARITPRSRAILLTTPHNPTGAILTAEDISKIGKIAQQHDLWIISDEVYEHLVFDDSSFVSPLSDPQLADRVIAVSSISKSHAAPGFRSGWCVGPAEFCAALLPVSETMLFGNQPFIADMTEKAVRDGSSVAAGMASRFASRALILEHRLHAETGLVVHRPEAGMFALVNVSACGMDGDTYAWDLLEHGVSVMPGSAFGESLTDWVRVALTIDDERFAKALDRIVAHANLSDRNVA
ncbi:MULTISPECIES: pyridoxal phosphate-dependent aminotransferase [unclassified Ruegeria]|uniref:pyridoxal phosphate-dependent aminotransferase n=1 Tax=unclassified Ruegeria TaxID=2625375 RepID=UPI001ADA19EE|nr:MULTISPECIES: pyridoxal phosphate-dependent aminotransferase [unclassified Ruegeria]MBO9412386.1 pyridoxal phosphate-dependent aminotransferase [Ruegeria sp. R8_1]MBO9416376.1 pyridoxal phosphate-dependent aminotransferase [Ruegeria sp. R8_2]